MKLLARDLLALVIYKWISNKFLTHWQKLTTFLQLFPRLSPLFPNFFKVFLWFPDKWSPSWILFDWFSLVMLLCYHKQLGYVSRTSAFNNGIFLGMWQILNPSDSVAFFTNPHPSDLQTRFLSDLDLITDSGRLKFRKINCWSADSLTLIVKIKRVCNLQQRTVS